MTKLSSSASRLPVFPHETSGEDRKTYRKWARISLVFYFFLTSGLIAVGILSRGSHIVAVMDEQPAATYAKSAKRHHPGG